MSLFGKETKNTLQQAGISIKQGFKMGLVAIGYEKEYEKWLKKQKTVSSRNNLTDIQPHVPQPQALEPHVAQPQALQPDLVLTYTTVEQAQSLAGPLPKMVLDKGTIIGHVAKNETIRVFTGK